MEIDIYYCNIRRKEKRIIFSTTKPENVVFHFSILSSSRILITNSRNQLIVWETNNFEKIKQLLSWIFKKKRIPQDVLQYHIIRYMNSYDWI